MKKAKLRILIDKLYLNFGTPFRIKRNRPGILDVLIATKLSQNTTDKSSYKAFTGLKDKFSGWEEVSEASPEQIKNCIRVCGLVNTKSREIKEMLLLMKKNYGCLDLNFLNKFVDEKVYEELLQYKGIGKKTVSCVLVFAMGRDAFPVDTHVHRVLNRTGIVRTNTPEKTFEEMNNNIPAGKKYFLHSGLIKFGRNICRSKNPLCGKCFFYGECGFSGKKFYRNKPVPAEIKENNFIILENL